MKMKTLKVMALIFIGLLIVQQGFPIVQNFFIDTIYALQDKEDDAVHSTLETAGTEQQDVEIGFSTETKQGSPGETVLIEFTSNQPLDEIDLILPAEAKIETSSLLEGVVIQQVEAEQWHLLSKEPLSVFLLPLIFEETGEYEVQVENEMLTVEIGQDDKTAEPETPREIEEEQSDEEVEDSEDGTKHARDDIFTTPDPDLPFDPNDSGNLYLLEGQEIVERGVSNWVEFLTAYSDPSVNYIYFERSFNSTNPATAGVPGMWNNGGSNVNGGENWIWFNQSNISRTLIVDGKGHTLDMQAVVLGMPSVSHNASNPWDVTLQNIKIYHGSSFGAFNFYFGGTENIRRSRLRYHNMMSVGNRLILEAEASVSMSGYVSSHQTTTYSSMFNTSWNISSTRNLANLTVNQIDIAENAEVSLSTFNSGNLDLRSGVWPTDPRAALRIGENAKLTLQSNGTSTWMDSAYGANIVFQNLEGNMTVGKGATVNLIPRANGAAITMVGNNGNIQLLEDSTVSIRSSGRTTSINGLTTNLIWVAAGNNLMLGEGSTLDIEAINQTSSGANIVNFSGTTGILQVGKDATLDIRSDTTATGQNLIGFSGANNATRFVIDEAKRVNLQKLNSMSTGNLIHGGGVTARRQSIQQWDYGNISGSSNFHWAPIFSMTANISNAANAVTNVTSVTSFLPDTEESLRTSFNSRSNRLLFEHVPNVEVTIDSLTEDPSLRNSRVISGRATPSSYIRFQREGALPEPEISAITTINQDTESFHVMSDANGYYEFDLSQYEPFERFQVGEFVTAHAMLYGEWASKTVIVEAIQDMDPKDPLQPDNTIDPDNPPDLGVNRGIISIDFISQFNFGSVPIRSSRTSYSAQPQQLNNAEGDTFGGKRPNFIQVTDRRAENSGWTLSARLGEDGFVSNDGHKLRGVELSLNNIDMVTTGSNNSMRPHYWESRALNTGRQTLANAEVNQGGGTWIQRYGDQETMADSVVLEVPSGAVPQATAYTATIHWELSFVPGMD
ncbi:WxL domain-containing protein [Enterococcus casseliflavus]|uniref:WxL domain-containing protein n=1 Tax=Enterococcus casseliflavus TaxID=37734 RepID=UPI0039A5729A